MSSDALQIQNDNGALSSAPDSPAIQSPPTNELSPPVKIDIDYAQRESDVRHEPLNISLDNKSDDLSSTRAQLATPANPGKFSRELLPVIGYTSSDVFFFIFDTYLYI